jgi:uncharacterized protein with PIN domain
VRFLGNVFRKNGKKLLNNNNLSIRVFQNNKCPDCGGDIVNASSYNIPALSSVGKKYKVCKKCGRVY